MTHPVKEDQLDVGLEALQTSQSHARKISKNKLELSVITNLPKPGLPMTDTGVVISKGVTKHAKPRAQKAISVISSKGIEAEATPNSAENALTKAISVLNSKKKTRESRNRKSIPLSELYGAQMERKSSRNQKLLGATTTQDGALCLEQNVEAPGIFHAMTPLTPAIVVTPAGHNESWIFQPEKMDSASVDRSHTEQVITIHPCRRSSEITTPLTANTLEPGRHKSQGWWNLMLSPLLRSNSARSRRGMPYTPSEPVPPLPKFDHKIESPALSPRSDPSFVLSAVHSDTSPDTPRRLGLASTLADRWSCWTQVEQKLEAQKSVRIAPEWSLPATSPDITMQHGIYVAGLAAEYYVACAVEQETAKPFFPCINHSCAERSMKLKSGCDVMHNDSGIISVLRAEETTEPLALADTICDNDLDEETSPKDFSPNVRQASAMPILVAKSTESLRSSNNEGSAEVPSESKSTKGVSDGKSSKGSIEPDISTAEAERSRRMESSTINSRSVPDPVNAQPSAHVTALDVPALSTPELRQAARGDALAALTGNEHQTPLPAHIVHNHYYNQESAYPQFLARPQASSAGSRTVETAKDADAFDEYMNEKLDRSSTPLRFRNCWASLHNQSPEEGVRLIWVAAIATGLLALLLSSVILAMTITRRGVDTQIQSFFVNSTNLPAMPVGISTIAAPNLQSSSDQCVEPSTMWSCSAMKDVSGNGSNQPSLRFSIIFQNTTAKDPFSRDLLTPNPAPSDPNEQSFLGQSTDNTTVPFDGESTPFFITFIPITPVELSVLNISSTTFNSHKRRGNTNSSSILDKIPQPAMFHDGTAEPASLLPNSPYPSAQPIRFYNRGQPDEHYGFYTYYDKSIFLSGLTLNDTKISSSREITADSYGGILQGNATVRCTFSQTRLLVKMYTNPNFKASLLEAPSDTPASHNNTNTEAAPSSATNFVQPGSWIYPTTITVDRHGGDASKKGVYCYGMQAGKIVASSKVLIDELRSIGGIILNQAGSDSFNKSLGGIDGGTGGCNCNWQNWQ